uniref:SH2 domain-containing protein 4A n=1 Tax=Pristiophorus japonicus TaxID=55135 RepID=UPI00398F129B
MLQQILQDMYIDPAVLDQLNEEQKQILFLKMRQEQVRRWKEREEKSEREEKKINKTSTQKESTKRVDWLLGKDGDVWVWVMGEARGDKPFEQICSETSAEARRFTENRRNIFSNTDTWNTDEQFKPNGEDKIYATCKVFEDDDKW